MYRRCKIVIISNTTDGSNINFTRNFICTYTIMLPLDYSRSSQYHSIIGQYSDDNPRKAWFSSSLKVH